MNRILLCASLVGLVPMVARAQTSNFDADMTGVALHAFSPSTALANNNTVMNAKGRAVGYGNPIQFSGPFAGANTISTARTVWAGFKLASTVPANQATQIGLLGFADNTLNPGQPVSLWLSIFAENTGLAGQVPRGAALVTNVPILIGDGDPQLGSARQWVSARFSSALPLTAGTKYWMAITPATTASAPSPSSWAMVMFNSIGGSGLTSQGFAVSDFGAWLYSNNSANVGGTGGVQFGTTSFDTNVVAAQFRTNPTAVNLTGTLDLNDTMSSFAAPRTIGYNLVQGTNTVASGNITVTASSSSFSVPVANGLIGNYTLELDGASFLLRKKPVTLTGSNVALSPTALLNGDSDNSGEVDAADIDAVIADFGGTAINTDVDASGEVDAADIDVVIANFGNFND